MVVTEAMLPLEPAQTDEGAKITVEGNGLTGPMQASFSNGKFTFSNMRCTSGGPYQLEISYGNVSYTLNFTVTAGRLGG